MRSSRRGRGGDLAGSRPYRPGDDVRLIDHRASARLSAALGSDEFVVREHFTEEAARVVVAVDRRPAMALFPPGLPWLSKPGAIAAAGTLVVESAVAARCLPGYLDDGVWSAPDGRTEPWRLVEHAAGGRFRAPEDALVGILDALAAHERALPQGSFAFVLSDFLAFPPDGAWEGALSRGWDVVPVVMQDPRWEQSFPDVAGVALPLLDPAGGRASLVRLNRAEADARAREHEARLAWILGRFEALGLDWVLVGDEAEGAVLQAFLAWAGERLRGRRLAG
jgi:uncharacterized protein (DUF58 family)